MDAPSANGKIIVGQTAECSHKITEEDVAAFARISGDTNPIHMDDAPARAIGFERRVVHGALCSSYLSGLMGQQLPGRGSVVLKMTLRFLKPVLVGETFICRVEITQVRARYNIVVLKVQGLVGDTCCCLGESYARIAPALRADV